MTDDTKTTKKTTGPNPDRLLGKALREIATLPKDLLKELRDEGALKTKARLKIEAEKANILLEQARVIGDYHEALRLLPQEAADRLGLVVAALCEG